MRSRWQYLVAALVGLIGALFGGIYGSLVAGFAGDSWWTSQFALSCFQAAAAIGGICVGGAPGMIWLFCLRQKWVLPVLGAATGTLLLPALQSMPLRNDTLGLLYAGVVTLGFMVGLSLWIWARRTASRRPTSMDEENQPDSPGR